MKILIKILASTVIVFLMPLFSVAQAQFADAPHFVNITVSSDPYAPQRDGNLKIDIGLHAAGQIVTAHVKMIEVSSGYVALKDDFRAGDGNNELIWNGKQIGSTGLAPGGTYKITVSGDYRLTIPGNGTLEEISKTFIVNSPVSIDSVISQESSTTSASSGSDQQTLKDKVELLNCSTDKTEFQLDANNKPNDILMMNCNLSSDALVNVSVYNSSFDPSAADNSANLINTLADKKMSAGGFFELWDGLDKYDQPVAAGDYVIAAEARPDNTYAPDISSQKFSVVIPPAPTTTTESTTTTMSTSSATSTTDSTTGTGSTNVTPIVNTTSTTEINTEQLAGQPSKCEGLNYPLDLPSGRFQSFIVSAYDQCWVSGYGDGNFRPDSSMTRAEAAKVIVLAAKIPPKIGCYTLDCGSPFKDLNSWQGQWVRAAWDNGIISGVAPDKFAPNRPITRAEAAALVVKGLKISPHQGCYTANCGAGFPNNFFLDITQGWEGPYLRALWDKNAAIAREVNQFEPDVPITRAEFLEMLVMAKG